MNVFPTPNLQHWRGCWRSGGAASLTHLLVVLVDCGASVSVPVSWRNLIKILSVYYCLRAAHVKRWCWRMTSVCSC